MSDLFVMDGLELLGVKIFVFFIESNEYFI